MKPIKLTKTSDGDNVLGWDEIIILDKKPYRKREGSYKDCDHVQGRADFYDYEYLCICDGVVACIFEDDLYNNSDCYKAELL